MDQMAYYNDSYFKENYNTYHEGDTSLICQNNILYYCGETKTISGMINVQENERVYLKLNSLEPSSEYCRFGIVSNIPLYSCIRSSVLHRKLISIHFSDQYVSTSHQLLSPASFLTIPYAKDYIKPGKDLKNVLGIILYEPHQLITLVSRGDEEDKILRMCI